MGTGIINARIRVRLYNSCARIYAGIFMKFETSPYKIEIDHRIKFHKDSSFRCGDICKTIMGGGDMEKVATIFEKIVENFG